jgi:hypothetical protein
MLYRLTLKCEEVPIYSRASEKQLAPRGCQELSCDYRIKDLDDSDTYWYVQHIYEQDVVLLGFVHEEDVGDGYNPGNSRQAVPMDRLFL